MAKQEKPAATLSAASEKQEPEMRDIMRQIKRVVKAHSTLISINMKTEAENAAKKLQGLRDYAVKRFQKELDEACTLSTEDDE